MTFRIRIIPATIMTAGLLLGVKALDVTNQLLIPTVAAEDKPKENTATAGDKAAAPFAPQTMKKDDKKADTSAAGARKDDAGAKKDDAKKDEGKKDDAAAAAAAAKLPDTPKTRKGGEVSDEAGDTVDHRFTAVELELLQNLAKRREELDQWEKNIQIKEEALAATEKHIDDKIIQIDAMKKEVAGLLAQYNEKEDAKIRSLVKIYENMKPKDAARIFDEVEMPILLEVIDKMSEKKAAPILAEMDSKKAKQITVELAAQRRVASQRLNLQDAAVKTP